jgi:hypothetical protein
MGKRSGSGAVLLLDTFVEDPLHQIEILAHAGSVDRLLTGTKRFDGSNLDQRTERILGPFR